MQVRGEEVCQEALVTIFNMRSTFYRVQRARIARDKLLQRRQHDTLTQADVREDTGYASPVDSGCVSSGNPVSPVADLAQRARNRLQEDCAFADRVEILRPCAAMARACKIALEAAELEAALIAAESTNPGGGGASLDHVHAAKVKDSVTREVC
jgi:hypothetical protein